MVAIFCIKLTRCTSTSTNLKHAHSGIAFVENFLVTGCIALRKWNLFWLKLFWRVFSVVSSLRVGIHYRIWKVDKINSRMVSWETLQKRKLISTTIPLKQILVCFVEKKLRNRSSAARRPFILMNYCIKRKRWSELFKWDNFFRYQRAVAGPLAYWKRNVLILLGFFGVWII